MQKSTKGKFIGKRGLSLMGKLKDNFGCELVGNTPPGTCPMCATLHSPELPHNKASLTYQYKFYDAFGRWPTWLDAMEHCPEEVKTRWIQAFKEQGIDIGVKGGNP